jgi:hypothetical protein
MPDLLLVDEPAPHVRQLTRHLAKRLASEQITVN